MVSPSQIPMESLFGLFLALCLGFSNFFQKHFLIFVDFSTNQMNDELLKEKSSKSCLQVMVVRTAARPPGWRKDLARQRKGHFVNVVDFKAEYTSLRVGSWFLSSKKTCISLGFLAT